MSKKNIARTAIEGGRVKSNKQERRQSNQRERKATRRLMHRVTTDPDCLDSQCFPQRDPVRKEFADKLSAPYRWVATYGAGKTVHEIRGMLLARFDTRSLAGRHLVFGHLMPSRFRAEWRVYAGHGYVTMNNRLVRCEPNAPHPVPKKHRIRARQWLSRLTERQRIGAVKDGFGLFVRLAETWQPMECTDPACLNRKWNYTWTPGVGFGSTRIPYVHPCISIQGNDPVPYHNVPRYRLERRLTADEVRLWNALLPHQQHHWDRVRNP